MKDRQRDIFVIGLLSGMCAAGSVMMLRAAQTVGILEENRKKNRKLLTLQHRIIERFAELSPEEVSSKIMDEFGFDVVTIDLDL